LKISSEGLD
jgi:hypothetical protein